MTGGIIATTESSLSSETLLYYLANTLKLIIPIGILSTVIGVASAWLIAMTEFPGRKFFEWALMAPLAIPGYISAYATEDFLEYSGTLQTLMRETFGWNGASDYSFPEVRNITGAIIVFSFSLYPYIYLLTKASFYEQSGSVFQAAKFFAHKPWKHFWRLTLPMSRPAIITGVFLVIAEIINDIGAVTHFSVDTITYGIFTSWLASNDISEVTKLSAYALILSFVILNLEKFSRKNSRYDSKQDVDPNRDRIKLKLPGKIAAFTACKMILAVGFIIPFYNMITNTMENEYIIKDPYFLESFKNTFILSSVVTLATFLTGIYLVYSTKYANRFIKYSVLIISLCYAIPGVALAIGVVLPFSYFDAYMNTIFPWYGPEFALTGSLTLLVLALTLRFLTISYGALENAFGRIPQNVVHSTSILGTSKLSNLLNVYSPAINKTAASAAILTFIDCSKELPVSLMIRPFNFDTLSIQVFEFASIEQFGKAAPAALAISIIGLIPVALISSMGTKSAINKTC